MAPARRNSRAAHPTVRHPIGRRPRTGRCRHPARRGAPIARNTGAPPAGVNPQEGDPATVAAIDEAAEVGANPYPEERPVEETQQIPEGGTVDPDERH